MDISAIDIENNNKIKDTPRNNALQHAQKLLDKNLIGVEEYAEILEKIKDKKNEKEWNCTYINILASVCEKGQCYRYMHEKSSDYYGKLSSQFTYLSMFFSFLLSAFTLITKDIEAMDINIITMISGVGHILIASITGIHKKMNLPENSEAHRKASKDFDTFCRKIEFQLKLPIDDRNSVPKYIFTTIDRYESIVSSSPKIPVRILRSFRHWASYNLKIDQPTIVKTFISLTRSTDCSSTKTTNMYYEDQDKKKYKKEGLKYMPEFLDNPDVTKLMKKNLSLKKKRFKK